MAENKQTMEEIFDSLVERAKNKRFSDIGYIQDILTYYEVKSVYKATRRVIRKFKKLAKVFYNDYLYGLKYGDDAVDSLSTCKIMSDCARFYEIEKCRLYVMLAEYKNYLFAGHLRDAIFYFERDGADDVDYTGVGAVSRIMEAEGLFTKEVEE